MQVSRITKKLNFLKKSKKKAFIPFITAGFPNLKTTEELIYEFDRLGCSVIELGVPFSDPMADGPVIQKAGEIALKNGVTLDKILKLVKKVRKKTQIPILLMGYYNPILQYGLTKFAKEAKASGVDGVLVVDLPIEESKDLERALKKYPIDIIYLLTPTSEVDRIKLVKKHGSGFVYYVSYTGTTGTRSVDPKDIKKNIQRIKKHIKIPINIGFGISKPEHVKKLAPLADGVVVGSAIIKVIEKNLKKKTLVGQVQKFIKSLLVVS